MTMLGKKHKPETIEKMKANHQGMLNKKHSIEGKEKISKSLVGNSRAKGKIAWNRKTVQERKETRQKYYYNRRAWVDSLKSDPCKDCGCTFPPECMDFDHIKGNKLFEIHGKIMGNKQALLSEIAKCDVICSNCHRIRTKKSALLRKRRQ